MITQTTKPDQSTGDQYGKTGFAHFRTMILNDLATLEEVYDRLERFLIRHSK